MEKSHIADGGMFQTELWNSFQKAAGKETLYIEGAFGQVSQSRFYFGRHAYFPRFPEDSLQEDSLQQVLKEAKKNKWLFVRVEPQSADLLADLTKKVSSVVKAPSDTQPREILMIDIAQSQEDLFKSFKSKTRYNIRLAEKRGVEVTPTRNQEDIEAFLNIMTATAERKNINFHAREYYKKFLDHFTEAECQLFVAKKDGVVLAGAILLFFENTAYYLHGGSSNSGRNMMAPHLLQWVAIQKAQEAGCTRYDFGGVAIKTTSPKGKDWQGITRFKQGFAPHTESLVFPGSYDIVCRPVRYWLYRCIQFFRFYV